MQEVQLVLFYFCSIYRKININLMTEEANLREKPIMNVNLTCKPLVASCSAQGMF